VEGKRYEVWALLSLTITVLVFCALYSYHASDPTLLSAVGEGGRPANWIGSFGANVAWPLVYLLGALSYGLPLIGLWTGWVFLRGRHPFREGRLQIAGFLLLLLTVATMAALYRETVVVRGQEMLTGGQAGNFLADFLAAKLNTVGSFIVLVGAFLAALMLSTPFSFRAIAAGAAGLAGFLWFGAGSMATKLKGMFRRPKRAPAGNPGSAPPSGAGGRKKPVRKEKTDPGESETAGSVAEPESRVEDPGALVAEVAPEPGTYVLPPIDLLKVYDSGDGGPNQEVLDKNSRTLEEKLSDFGVSGKVVGVLPGPVITMYEYSPAPGIKISRIVNLSNDLTMALKAVGIRVVAPIPGKAAVGIEIPNPKRELVSIRSVLEEGKFNPGKSLSIALGQDITGRPVVSNLQKMPHLLIAGATGTGKSVCINSLLTSLLYHNTPENLRLLLVDPKRIELSSYESIPHLIHPVVKDAKLATRALKWAVEEMELRYKLLADKHVRNIESYNKAVAKENSRRADNGGEEPAQEEEGGLHHHPLPYIVIIIDELADLMMVASRDVEESITRLAQMARAAGIHLILATQRPSVDVLTGVIKANFPTRISFKVSSKVDSRTVLDNAGAECLLGAGDMLFLPPGTDGLQRIHGAFISDEEVERLTEFWRNQQLAEDPLGERVDFESPGESDDGEEQEADEKYDEAVEIVLKTRHASISMLQRRLRVGYNRAARMIEMMEKQGLVTASDGSKPREVVGPRPE
jgi:S-DNA-T family DNA segregation ATPase FtsK/SpoIIIE